MRRLPGEDAQPGLSFPRRTGAPAAPWEVAEHRGRVTGRLEGRGCPGSPSGCWEEGPAHRFWGWNESPRPPPTERAAPSGGRGQPGQGRQGPGALRGGVPVTPAQMLLPLWSGLVARGLWRAAVVLGAPCPCRPLTPVPTPPLLSLLVPKPETCPPPGPVPSCSASHILAMGACEGNVFTFHLEMRFHPCT